MSVLVTVHTDADQEYCLLDFVLNYNRSAMQFAHEKWIVYHEIIAFMGLLERIERITVCKVYDE
jgi:hypothetical protein